MPLYDNEESVCGIIYLGMPYFFIKNLQGDVISISNRYGETVARYSYDAWGVCTITQESATGIAGVNPYRYRSYYYDTESGLYYLQSRYYDPEIGRFINADDSREIINTIINTSNVFNLYSYCINNPINYIDITGQWFWVVVGAIVVGGVAYGIGRAVGLGGWKLALLTAIGAALGAIVGNALTPLLKSLAWVFVNWGKAIGVVSQVWGYKLMIHWPHHNKGIHIVLQKMTQYGNWRNVFEKMFKG